MPRRVLLFPVFLVQLAALIVALPAWAEREISFYTGWQTAPHSRIEGNDPGGVGAFDALIGWEGKSFEPPIHYGARLTFWRSDTFGWGIDINHAKVYAPRDERQALGFDRLELSDGHNIVTVNAYRRWPQAWQTPFGALTPYAGAGLGVAVPHVDVESAGGRVYEFQLTGPAAVWMAGVRHALDDRFTLFAEYKGSYSDNTMDLGSGGELRTEIITNALNLGLAWSF